MQTGSGMLIECSKAVTASIEANRGSESSAGPDEMQHYAAIHLGLHGLPKCPFRSFPYTKGLMDKLLFISQI